MIAREWSTVPEVNGKNLREQAYELRYDPSSQPPPDEVCLTIGGIPVAARGNLTGIQGKPKAGKTSVISAVVGAALRGDSDSDGDTLEFKWVGKHGGAVIHLDTEQSPADWHALVGRAIKRSGVRFDPERLLSLPLVQFPRLERMEILIQTLEHERMKQGSIDCIIIDGIADLCSSPNDEAECLGILSEILALCHEFNTPAVCIIHENPGTDQGKTRGHLGSELTRKAFANLRVDKDSGTGVSTIYGTDMRRREIPKEQGFCFAWDEVSGMHKSCGRLGALKKVDKAARARLKAWEQFADIYEHALKLGTYGSCPALSPHDAALLRRDLNGTEKPMKAETMKKRMQRAEALGILTKPEDGRWALVDRDKWDSDGTNDNQWKIS